MIRGGTLPALPKRTPDASTLPGLQKMNEQELASMSPEAVTQLRRDLEELDCGLHMPQDNLSHEETVQLLLDVRDALKGDVSPVSND